MTHFNNIKEKQNLLELKKFDTKRSKVAIRVNSDNYALDLAKGKIPGHSIVRLRGRLSGVNSGEVSDIWDMGGLMNYPTSAVSLYISSESASDVGNVIYISGLDENYDLQSQTVVTNGQNQVKVMGSWLRFHSAVNIGNIDLTGDIYIAEKDLLYDGVPKTASRIYGKIKHPNNNTFNCTFTVPRNHTLYLCDYIYSTPKGKSVTAKTLFRSENGVWIVMNEADAYETLGQFPLLLPAPIQGKSDIKGQVYSYDDDNQLTLYISGILVDNTV